MSPPAIGLVGLLSLSVIESGAALARDCPDDRVADVTLPGPGAGAPATVMIDGVLSPGEWDGAVSRGNPETGAVHVMRSGSYLNVAVVFPEGEGGFVDLFVSMCGETYALHASAKLGERRVTADSADWDWWNNAGWVANTTRVDSFEARTFLPAPVREFQIALDKFAGRLWGLRVELTSTDPGGSPAGSISIPAEGEWLLDTGERPTLQR